jgi:hypothetical protein
MPDRETLQVAIAKLRGISAKIEVAMLEIDGVMAVLEQNSRLRRLDRLRNSRRESTTV